MSYVYGFGQETMAPEQYLQKSGTDYAQNLYLTESEIPWSDEPGAWAEKAQQERTEEEAVAARGEMVRMRAQVAVAPPAVPKPVQAGLGGWAVVLGLGLLGAFLWMK